MSINKLVSIKTPILDAIDQLALGHMQDIPVFTRWATLAEKEISSYFQFKLKREVIDVCGCIAYLPNDAAFLQRAVLGDLGKGCDNLFANLCSQIEMSSATLNASAASTSFLIVDFGTGYTDILGSIPHVVQDNKIILNNSMDGMKITVQYLAYECDEEGFLMVGQNHVNAIMWFILYKYYIRKMSKPGTDYLDRDLMRTAQQEWNRECANARAKDGAPTESEQAEMADMISSPYIGNSLGVGMFTTLSNTYGW